MRILEAYNGMEAWTCIRQEKIDMVVLDIMMHRLDGIQLLQMLRTEYKLPVILLSAKKQDNDKIMGLKLGADDFIAKPFNPQEAVARIQAVLRRTYEFNEPVPYDELDQAGQSVVGELTLDHQTCVLYKVGRKIPLTAIEYKLLTIFMKSPGRIYTKKQLFEKAWSEHYYEDANTVMVHISRLREKMEDSPKQPVYIRTIRGLGYKFAKKDGFDGKSFEEG